MQLFDKDGNEVTEKDIKRAAKEAKKGEYRRKMIEKFGEDVFIKKAQRMQESNLKMTPERRTEIAKKAVQARINKRKESDENN